VFCRLLGVATVCWRIEQGSLGCRAVPTRRKSFPVGSPVSSLKTVGPHNPAPQTVSELRRCAKEDISSAERDLSEKENAFKPSAVQRFEAEWRGCPGCDRLMTGMSSTSLQGSIYGVSQQGHPRHVAGTDCPKHTANRSIGKGKAPD